jgi:hypothetical protein
VTPGALQQHDKDVRECVIKTGVECRKTARERVRTAYAEADPDIAALLLQDPNAIIPISVSFDGTWQKCGFTSLYGVGVVIGVMTGLVLDYHLLSKYCHACEQNKARLTPDEFVAWQRGHDDCCKNHHESSTKMEQVAAEVMWGRSKANGFCYIYSCVPNNSVGRIIAQGGIEAQNQ